MLDFTEMLKRFTSRLLIGFVITMYVCINYTTIDPWIFVTSFGIFAITYCLVKICSFYTGISKNGEINEPDNKIVDENGKFMDTEIL